MSDSLQSRQCAESQKKPAGGGFDWLSLSIEIGLSQMASYLYFCPPSVASYMRPPLATVKIAIPLW